ncbi:hypothetical protein [Antrihabitans stalactiti]|uniref:Uncharacterized protein n=1 Tax=Antrihabitans stalactiti TaxID=2584121 RepID=A0A848KGG9_9NOCA|nr:hypothetical protein [Antrihabitans stalactiti]NMN97271.1 hypothetical protein [Antrihabitans stalactiti]
MTGTQLTLIIVGSVLLGNILFQGLMWTLILRHWRKQWTRVTAEVERAIRKSGARTIRPPYRARYMGSTSRSAGRVNGKAIAALTDEALILQTFRGGPLIYRADGAVTGVRESRSFRRSASAGWTNVVLGLADGGEVGFAVREDAGGWVRDVKRVVVGIR